MVVTFLRIIFLVSIGINVSFGTTTQFHSTLNTLRQLDGAVEQYQMEHKRLPTEAEGLAIVKEYVKGGEILLDLWGNPYVYRSPGVHSTNEYEIYSMGADGRSKSEGNDPDDIKLWDDEKTQREKYKKYYGGRQLRRHLVWPVVGGVVVGFVLLFFLLWLFVGAVWTRWKGIQ